MLRYLRSSILCFVQTHQRYNFVWKYRDFIAVCLQQYIILLRTFNYILTRFTSTRLYNIE